jgi:hypothetical protein
MIPAVRFTSALAFTVVAAAACDPPFGPDRPVILRVTDIEAPTEVPPGESVLVRFTVHSGGCTRFTEVGVTRTGTARVTLTARGRDSSGPKVSCPADIRMDVRGYRAEPPISDPFTIAVRQPDGNETIRTVRVR